MRVLVSALRAADLAARARAEIAAFEACASRFLPDSELVRLNADPRPVVPSSQLPGTLSALLCGCRAERRPRRPDAARRARGRGLHRLVQRRAIRARRVRVPGAGTTASRCEVGQVRVDDGRGTIERPPGLRLDLGGSGKGFAADRVAALLARAGSWLVDAGGDIRFGGRHEVLVGHPLVAAPAARLQMTGGAVATSSIVRRAWAQVDGRRAHHLLDPATGEPV